MEEINEHRRRLLEADAKLLDLPTLSAEEEKVNAYLSTLKSEFLGIYSINDMIDYWGVIHSASTTRLFQFLYSMPKGVMHHMHDLASLNWEKFLEAAASFPEIYIDPATCIFKVSSEPVEGHVQYSEYSKTRTHADFADKELRFSAEVENGGIENVWPTFQGMLGKIIPIAGYKPFWEVCQAAIYSDFHAENYQRIELRTGPFMYDSNGRFTKDQIIQAYKTSIDKFTAQHGDFSVGYIANGFRWMNVEQVEEDAFAIYEAAKSQTDYVLGYDIVCEEDAFPPISQYNEVFARLGEKIKQDGSQFKFYFHSGETVLRGKEGVYDACLFDSVRIGHGIDLIKHPAALEALRSRGTTVELNPISNRCLGYGRDLRNHPGWTLMNHGVRCSISSDDPAVFCNHGGSYDWLWVTILWDLDLAHIKKLVLNSILGANKTEETMAIWEAKWQSFVSDILAKLE